MHTIVLEKDNFNLNVGQTDNIKVTVGGELKTSEATYSSNKTNIATVDSDGTIHAIAEGNAIITVHVDDTEEDKTVNVTVIKNLVTNNNSIIVIPESNENTTTLTESLVNSRHNVQENNVLGVLSVENNNENPTTSNVEIDVSDMANNGDKLSVYKYENDDWEWVALETVNNSTISITVVDDTEIAIVRTNSGLFNRDGSQIYTWEQLLSMNAVTVSNNTITGSTPSVLNGILVIDDNITTIGNNAFENCSGLINVTFSKGVTSIGDRAFSMCTSLESVYFPKTITSIGSYVYYLCENIAYINVASDNPSFASLDGVLYTGDMTKLILCPNGKKNVGVVVPEGVTTIGYSGFSTCRYITSIQLPSTLRIIETKGFKNCTSLTRLDIPREVTRIDADAFVNVAHVYYTGTATGSPWGAKAIN